MALAADIAIFEPSLVPLITSPNLSPTVASNETIVAVDEVIKVVVEIDNENAYTTPVPVCAGAPTTINLVVPVESVTNNPAPNSPD